ncbi:hypothetical protein [Methylobacterium sp. AMS5]|uniref:DUF7336 domain-containing protein n=1 Tax=Methylobacterium sp. AMS5 TaxID=925818 RepID=UPI00074F9EA8|nr:hypothetical protein [Methylobacterium sp. AMS5]AMB44063.1 hypothetical protein Y590_04080 [Methylobacterium sp. AMS5]
MDTVYLLWHVRADDQHADDAKLIGVYRSQESADAAVLRVKGQPGFRDHPEGFEISVYSLDKDHWTTGFVSVRQDEDD